MIKKWFIRYIQLPVIRILQNTKARRILWWALFFLISFVVLATNIMPDHIALKAGEIASKDIFYNGRVITYTSEIKTSEAKDSAAQDVEQVFQVDEQVLQDLDKKVENLFQNIKAVKNDNSIPDKKTKIEKLKQLMPEKTSESSLIALTDANNEIITMLEIELKGIIHTRMQDGVTQEELEKVYGKIIKDIESLDIKPSYKVLFREIVYNIEIKPNKIYDPVATAQRVESKLAKVKPVQVTYQPGERIIEKGTVVTKEQIEALQYLGLQRNTAPFWIFAGLFGFVIIVYTLLIVYLTGYKPGFLKEESNIILLGLLINVSLIIARIVTAIHLSDRPEITAQLGYAIPIAATSMLTAILIDNKTAVFITIVMGLFTGIITNGQMAYGTVAMIGGLVGVYRVSKLSQRSHLVNASLFIGISSALTSIFLGLTWNQPVVVIGLGAIMGLINGILASIITIGTLPFLEGAFRITTSVKLLELSNPNHPLLKRLMVEAPGTYHHSILVGNLAEAAADAIGADSLLVRVASYYHDIGKIKRPYFFIENQLSGENPHDKIAPTLSTLILTSHVKDGVELAKEYKFPKIILDIIEQHHGTSLISYFYHKAKESSKAENVLASDFRYQNSKPQNRETAIIMLADSIQAAVQVLEKPTKGHLEVKVREIIKQKLDDGQLNECNLTFKDLDIIAQSIVRVLNGMFHSRIDYPDQVANEMERGKSKNGANYREQTGQNTSSPGNGKHC